ncbi:MAG: hypothetical protein FWD58_03205 [Firmicutes bacterium]|nr:hypothetical protein [Bacillota bacterium]
MKSFKKIYYPVMALAVVLAVIFSFVSANYSLAPQKESAAFMNAVKAHAKTLSGYEDRNSLYQSGEGGGAARAAGYISDELNKSTAIHAATVTVDDDGFDTAEIVADENGRLLPTLFIPNTLFGANGGSIPSSETLNRMNAGKDDKAFYVEKRVRNIAVFVPGTKTIAAHAAEKSSDADAVLITTRYDAIGAEATNAAIVGVMIEHAKKLAAASPTFENDFLFVFADAGLERSVGLHTFLNQFKGFENVCERVTLAARFDSLGNGGPLTASFSESAALAAAAATAVGVGQVNSFADYFYEDAYGAPTNLFKSDRDGRVTNTPVVSFVNVGKLRNQRASGDSLENLSNDVVRAHAEAMGSFVGWAGSTGGKSGDAAAYFSYYNAFTLALPAPVAVVLAVLVLLLLAGALVLNYFTKAFNPVKALAGALIQVLALAAALVVVYGVTFLVLLLNAGFGVIGIQSMVAFNLMKPGIIISAAVVFAAIMVAVYVVLKKAFLVKGPDLARGGVLVTGLIAIIAGLAVPAIGLPFVALALFQGVVLLLSTLVKKSYKKKFGEDIERLFLYVWPAVLCMPLLITTLSLAATLGTLLTLPVLLLLFALPASVILPYADYLKPALNKLFNKFPSRVVRYEEEVTEMVEDRAKKGKFTAVKRKKISTEKVPWNYQNRVGIIIAALFAGVSMLLFSAYSGGYDSKIVSNAPTFDNVHRAAAFNYVYSGYSRFEVADQQAYNTIADAGVTMKWDGDRGVREKSVPLLVASDAIPTCPVEDSTAKRLVYKAYSASSRIKLTVTGARDVTKFKFNRNNYTSNSDIFAAENLYEFVNEASLNELVFFFPAYNSARHIRIEYEGGGSVTFEFEEQNNSDKNPFRDNADYQKLVGNKITKDLNFNLIFITKKSV